MHTTCIYKSEMTTKAKKIGAVKPHASLLHTETKSKNTDIHEHYIEHSIYSFVRDNLEENVKREGDERGRIVDSKKGTVNRKLLI